MLAYCDLVAQIIAQRYPQVAVSMHKHFNGPHLTDWHTRLACEKWAFRVRFYVVFAVGHCGHSLRLEQYSSWCIFFAALLSSVVVFFLILACSRVLPLVCLACLCPLYSLCVLSRKAGDTAPHPDDEPYYLAASLLIIILHNNSVSLILNKP